jgi:cytochrome c peroxidase
MKKWFAFLLGFSVVLVIVACEKTAVSALDEELKDAMSKTVSSGDIRDYLLPDGSDYSKIPNQDAKNPINSFKVALGKMLFYETGIGLVGHDGALKQTYSCSSCHIPSMGFTPGRFQGIADGAVGFGDHGEGR